MIKNCYLDEGTPTWRPGPADLTRLDAGFLPAEILMGFPSAEGEDELFHQSPTGRMTPEAFADLVSDLKVAGMRYPVTIHVEQDRRVLIHEGNHRLRAAHQAKLQVKVKVKVEVKYFGNGQQHGLVFQCPDHKEFGELVPAPPG